MITLMPKKFAKNSTFGKLSEEGPYQNNWLFNIGRVCFYKKGVMKFIITFSLTLLYQVSFTSWHLLFFVRSFTQKWRSSPKEIIVGKWMQFSRWQWRKMTMTSRTMTIRKMRRRYFTDNIHLNLHIYGQSIILGW